MESIADGKVNVRLSGQGVIDAKIKGREYGIPYGFSPRTNFAINNQPLTLAFEAKAQKRDDVPDYPTDWLVQGGAQLRFSLFAPPRRSAKTQDSL